MCKRPLLRIELDAEPEISWLMDILQQLYFQEYMQSLINEQFGIWLNETLLLSSLENETPVVHYSISLQQSQPLLHIVLVHRRHFETLNLRLLLWLLY